MIVFDLRCACGHVFEAWFGSSEAFGRQRAAAMISCPVCGGTEIDKAVMAPSLAMKGNRDGDRRAVPPAARLAAAQQAALASSRWVGVDFARRARAMHDGEEPRATIHGVASREDAVAMMESGVPVTPLPFPVVPPDQVN